MRNGSFRHALSVGIDQTNLMALARPVDAHKPFNLFRHAQALLSHHSHPGRRNERQSLYWRSKRNLPRDFRRGRPAGAQVPFRCSKHRIRGLLPVGRPGSASLQCRPANDRFEGYRDSNRWSLLRPDRSSCEMGMPQQAKRIVDWPPRGFESCSLRQSVCFPREFVGWGRKGAAFAAVCKDWDLRRGCHLRI